MLIYRNVAMVMVATLFLQAAMGALGVALPLAMSGAGWGRPAIGAVIAAFGAGFAIGAWLSPNMIRSVGHIRAYAGYAGGAAALTLLLALGDHFIWWLITRFGFGMCAAGLFAVAESWIADATPSERRGAVISVYQIVGRAGLIAGPFLIAFPGFDARDGFIMAGAAMALALTPIVFTKRAQPSLPTGETVPVTRLFSIAPAAAAAAFTAGLLNSGVLGFMPIWAQSLDPEYGAGSAALLMAVIYAGSMITQWPAGMISDQMDRRLVIAALSIVGGLFALILVVMPSPSLGLAALLVGLWGAASLSYFAVAVAHAADRSRVEELPAIASGMLLVWAIGSTLGPIVAGVAYSGPLGPRGLFLFAAVASCILAAGMFWRRRAREAVKEDERSPFVNLQATSAELAEIEAPEDELDRV